jgi:esterase/lipase superfamily enzyme
MKCVLFNKSVAIAVVLSAACSCSQQLMPTPNLIIQSDDDPFDDVPAALQTSDADILFVTDRAETKDKKGQPQFGHERSKALSYGSFVVGIGKNINWADLVSDSRTKSRRKALPLSRREIRVAGQFPATPPPRIVVDGAAKVDPEYTAEFEKAQNAFHQEIARRVALNTTQKEAFIFVHGFAYTIDDAAFVIADLWHFLGRRGVPIAYTWPAGMNYAYDRESGEFTIHHFKQFLRVLAACPEIERINIVAHSRGTDVMVSALRELNIELSSAGKDTRKELKLGNLILAAPDLDLDVTGQRIGAEGVFYIPERMTIYVSQSDTALGAAAWFFKSRRRLGDARAEDLDPEQKQALLEYDRLQIINSRISGGSYGHDYFHSSPAVSSDVIRILRDNRGPGEENGRPMKRGSDGFWEITDDYMLSKKK